MKLKHINNNLFDCHDNLQCHPVMT